MPDRFCNHLQDYALLFVKAEASYEQCLKLVDRIVEDGPGDGLGDSLLATVQQWQAETSTLREAFSRLLEDGKIKLPRNRFLKARCKACQHLVPRLQYSEWKVDDNGKASFRGGKLPDLAEAASPA